jgi:uncharacterized protein YodC (DUF2158 family)
MTAFKIGDVVTLKGVSEAEVRCVWADGRKILERSIHPDMLTMAPAPPKTLEELIEASHHLDADEAL